MATRQPKKADNLEIIKHSLGLEIEKRAPVSNSFGSAPLINSSVYLRTQSKGEKKTKNSGEVLCKVRGNFINWGLYGVNGIQKYPSHETGPVVGGCHLLSASGVLWPGLLHKSRCCLSSEDFPPLVCLV